MMATEQIVGPERRENEIANCGLRIADLIRTAGQLKRWVAHVRTGSGSDRVRESTCDMESVPYA